MTATATIRRRRPARQWPVNEIIAQRTLPLDADPIDIEIIEDYLASPRHPAHLRAHPLELFTFDHALRIVCDALWDSKPDRWLYLGCVGDSRPMAAIESRSWYEWHWYRGVDPDSKRDPLPRWLRQAVIDRDGYICGLCGGDVQPDDIHIDHIKPKIMGGLDRLDNLQVAHSTCNLRKGARYE